MKKIGFLRKSLALEENYWFSDGFFTKIAKERRPPETNVVDFLLIFN